MEIMSDLFLLTLCLSGLTCNKLQSFDGSVELVSAVLQSFTNETTTVKFISVESFIINDFQNEILSKVFTKTNILTVQETLKTDKKSKEFRSESSLNVFLCETSDEVLSLLRKTSPRNSKYLIVLTNEIAEKPSKLDDIFYKFWSSQALNVNVMFACNNRTICVQTFIPFNAENCNDTSPILINEFIDGKFSNDVVNFFPQKTKNLHKCPVRVSISNNSHPHIFTKDMNDSTHQLSGRDINLVETLGKSLNFRINYSYCGEVGYIFENGSSFGTLDVLKVGNADLSVSDWWLKENRLKFFDVTTSYINDQIVFIVPPGRDLTAFEKIVYPFSTSLWIAVIIFYFGGAFVIFIVKKRPENVKKFVFGTGVRNPYMNLFIAWIGGSQKVLPTRNFARFLLMLFLMYSLIIRTLYQASFYQLLKSKKRYEEVQTIDEIVERDYKIYVFPWTADLFQEAEATKNRYGKQKSGLCEMFDRKQS